MQLPTTDEIVLVSGLPPIRVRKARYYEDRRLTARILPPPLVKGDERGGSLRAAMPYLLQDDWTMAPLSLTAFAEVERSDALTSDADDPANGGIRREPEIPDHEAVAPERAGPARSREEPMDNDDHDDEDAIRARALHSRFRSVARQATMDPDDGIAL